MGKKTGLTEQGAFGELREEKGFLTFGRRGRQLRKSTRMSLGHTERKSER